MVKEEKVQQVKELAQKAAESGAVVFSDYSGLTVAEMAELRRKLFDLGADLRVVKNTLLRLALEKAALSAKGGSSPEANAPQEHASGGKDGELEGPTVALFSRGADPLESIKTLVLFLKEKGKGVIKFGFFSAKGGEKTFLTLGKVLELATIPSKPVLQAWLVSQLKFPIFKLAYVLAAQQKKLVMVLDRVAKSKGGETVG